MGRIRWFLAAGVAIQLSAAAAAADDQYGTWYWEMTVVSDDCDDASPPGTESFGWVSVLPKSGNEVWVEWLAPARPRVVGTIAGNTLTFSYRDTEAEGYVDTTVTTTLTPTASYTEDRSEGTSTWDYTDVAFGGVFDCGGSDRHVALRHDSLPGSVPSDIFDFFTNFPPDSEARLMSVDSGAVHSTGQGCQSGMAPCLRFDQLGLAFGPEDFEFVGLVVSGTFEQGTIELDYRVSSEASYDLFLVLVDGEQQAFDSGESGWTQASIPISAGAHEILFTYGKDSTVSLGSDTAWLDAITFVPEPAPGAMGLAALGTVVLLRRARARRASNPS